MTFVSGMRLFFRHRPFTPAGLETIQNIGELGEDAIENFLRYGGSASVSTEQLLKYAADLKLAGLSGEAKDGLKILAKQFSSVFNKSHGGAHQLGVIAQFQEAGAQIINVEKRIPISSGAGKIVGDRVYDAIVKIGNQTVYVECKAWSPANFKQYLTNSMKFRSVGLADAAGQQAHELPGQLFKDIVEFQRHGFEGVQWVFDKRLAGREGEIKAHILGLLNDVDTKSRFITFFELDNEIEYQGFIRNMELFIDSFITVAP